MTVKDPAGNALKSFGMSYLFSESSNFSNTWTTDELTHRMFLSAIREKDQFGVSVGKHDIEYDDINGLPPRLSYAQDHWGYFNGVDNEYFVPVDLIHQGPNNQKLFEGIGGDRELRSTKTSKGILKKITYPTGGSSTFQYAQNSYHGEKTIFPTPTPMLVAAGAGADPSSKTYLITNVVYAQEMRLQILVNLLYPENEDPHHDIVGFSVRDLTTGYLIESGQHVYGDPIDIRYVNLSIGHQYKFEITAGGNAIYATMSGSYIATLPQVVNTAIETGGLRIARIDNFDPISKKTESIYYNYAATQSPAVSSGVTQGSPIYYNTTAVMNEVTCSTAEGPETIKRLCYYGSLYSSSQSNLLPMNGKNIYYRYVVLSRSPDFSTGAEQHEFQIHFDYFGEVVWGGDNIMNTPFTNFGWDNGLEKKITHFKKGPAGLIPLKQITNEYVTDERFYKEVPNLVVRRKYEPTHTQSVTIACDASNVGKKVWQFRCTAIHEHKRTNGGHPYVISTGPICIAPGHQNQFEEVAVHPCHDKPLNSTVPFLQALDHLDAVEYKSISYWFYLKSVKEEVFDEQGLNPMVTLKEFTYDNPLHALPSKEKITASDNRVQESITRYVDDYGSVENLAILKQKFIVRLPVKTETLLNNQMISGNVLRYNDNGQLAQVHNYEASVPKIPLTHNPQMITPSADYKYKASFSYDTANNMKEVEVVTSPLTSYQWGYNNTLVTAKVVGSSSNDVFITSFEIDGTVGVARTGDRYWNSGTFAITATAFPSVSNNLSMTYWYWENNQWNFSGEVPFTRTITAGTRLDEIRVYTKGSVVVTYTYDIARRISSITDHNGVSTYFEYDSAGRLTTQRDSQKKVTQTIKYKYKNAQ
jgi:YD repeat-containing protein